MSSKPTRPHVERLRADPRAALVVQVEEPTPIAGVRPNWQVRCTGLATVQDVDNTWTNAVSAKYMPGDDAELVRARRAHEQRVVISPAPRTLLAVGTHPGRFPLSGGATSAPA